MPHTLGCPCGHGATRAGTVGSTFGLARARERPRNMAVYETEGGRTVAKHDLPALDRPLPYGPRGCKLTA